MDGLLPIQGICDIVNEYGQALEGHCVQVLPDGHTVRVLAVLPHNKLAAASFSIIRIWDTASGCCVHTLRGHTHLIVKLAVVKLSVLDTLLVSAGMDNIRIWDTLRGTCVHAFAHCGRPNGMLVWGENLAISSGDAVRLWNLETCAWSRKLEGHTNTVTAMEVCRERCGERCGEGSLASGSRDATVRVWDENGCAHVLTGHTHIVFALAPLPDNRLASSSSDRSVRVWDTQAGLCLFTLEGHARSVEALAFNGKLISGAHDHTLRVWDIETGECLHELNGYGQGVRGLAVMPGNMIASFSVDKNVQIWDVESGVIFLELVGHTEGIMCAISLPDGKFASGSLDCSLRVWK